MVALGLLVAVTLVPFGMKSLATPAHAATSVTGGQLFTTAGTGCQVTVSFISAEASFNDYLFLSSTVPPSGGTPTGTLLFNHGAPSGPTTISVPASSELIFAINVDNPSNGTGIDATWYMGPGTRNADGQPHAIVTDNGGGNFTVAFEDIAIPSQYTDYNDLVYSFQGSCLTANPHLSITKTATEKSYSAVGNVIHYTIVAKNDGNVTLPAVTVVDPKVSGLTCTPANGSSLAAGGTMTCTGTHTIVQADITAGHYANTACVDDGPGGATQACASADVPAVVISQGRMTGGGSVFTAAGVRVTHGFEIHCDVSQSPNNIEVNWGGGQNFHLTSLTSAQCVDDPSIIANPPNAGFDTFIGAGTGTFNGVAGAHIQFTFTDAGEPGTKDSATIKITDAGGNVVLQVSGLLDKGNQQAHKN